MRHFAMNLLGKLCVIAGLASVSALAQPPANPLADFRSYTRDLASLSGLFTQEVRDKNGRVATRRIVVA